MPIGYKVNVISTIVDCNVQGQNNLQHYRKKGDICLGDCPLAYSFHENEKTK